MNRKSIILLVLIAFLGILYMINNNNREGLGVIQPAASSQPAASTAQPTITADKAKSLAGSFKKQMAAAGIPQATTDQLKSAFDQLSSLVSLEIAASGKSLDDIQLAELTTPVEDTLESTCLEKSFFTGTKMADAFCKTYQAPMELNAKCGTLTSDNCNATDCCIFVNGTKCMAGNARGPLLLAGVKADADYYSYKYQCYGACK